MGHFCWFLVASLGLVRTRIATWKCSAPRRFCVWSTRCKRNMSSKHIMLKKQWIHGFYLEKCQDSKKKQCWLRGVVLRLSFSVFRWKITLWWNVVQGKIRGREKEEEGWRKRGRCRNATRFRNWLVASENYRHPYVHPKGEKISMCWLLVLRLSSPLLFFGRCWELLNEYVIFGELTLGISAPLSLWGYGSTLCTLLWSHINVTTVFDGVKGLPPPVPFGW